MKHHAIAMLATGAVSALSAASAFAQPLPGGSLDPTNIPKYVTPLLIPPAMPKSTSDTTVDYQIAVRQFRQQILPAGFPATTVWGYGSVDHPGTVAQGGTFNYPAFTVEATKDVHTTVKWVNGLTAPNGNFLPHLFPVDQTLHWANPPAMGCADGTSRTDCATLNPVTYTGPVPIVTHLHGAHVDPHSDGYPEAWWLPAANDIPAGYATEGSNYGDSLEGSGAGQGYAVFDYRNDQPSTTLWYHDHALGVTRVNVYAGMAGFWLIREPGGGETGLTTGTLPGPAPKLGDAPGTKYYEIPIVIQDRAFNRDGSLFYPDQRSFFQEMNTNAQLGIPFIGDNKYPSDISPIWNPEAFFNTMVVNGRTWPFLDVDRSLYRFRIVNGCNSRFLNLALRVVNADGTLGAELPIHQIGAEQSLLSDVVEVRTGQYIIHDDETGNLIPVAAPDPQQALLVGIAERADVIVDFRSLPAGTRVRMINTGPDAPFGGFPVPPADPGTTGQVMEFVVGPDTGPTGFTPPTDLALADIAPITPDAGSSPRRLTLNEMESESVCVQVKTIPPLSPNPVNVQIKYLKQVLPGAEFQADCAAAGGVPFAPRMALLGTGSNAGNTVPLSWGDPLTELITPNATEEWQLANLTEDAHPIHPHLIKFQVVAREAIGGGPSVVGVMPWESGWKDTVITYPGEVTKVRAKFDIPGLYAWHCHVIEHEDNEMMRPFCVGNTAADCPPI